MGREHAPADIIIALAANKVDLMGKHNRDVVSLKDGYNLAYEESIQIFKETSAKENLGIQLLFLAVCKHIYEH